MKESSGIALVVTLMLALLLFLAIIAVSSSISLSGKRVTSNQKAALEAQYAAESGLALAATRLNAIGGELEDFIKNRSDFKMPASTDWISLRSYLQLFCGLTTDTGNPAYVPTSKPPLGSVICNADQSLISWTNPNDAPYKIFLDGHINPSRYPPGSSPTSFWRERLGPLTANRIIKSSGKSYARYSVSFGLVPWRAEVLPNGTIRLIFRSAPTVSSGYLTGNGGDLARHKIEKEFGGELRVDLRPPSFSHFMLFTNYQRSGAARYADRVYFYSGSLFDGPVHTNEKFNFTGEPWFGDTVTSVGCEVETANKDGCRSKEPGYYYWDTTLQTDIEVSPPIDPIPASWADPAFEAGHYWNKEYIALPRTSKDQYYGATHGGIFIEDPDTTASAGDINVVALTISTDVVGGVKYQFIQVHGRRNVGTRTTPGHCAPKAPPSGSPGSPSPPPAPGGPAVRHRTPPPEFALLFAARLGAPGPGRALAGLLELYRTPPVFAQASGDPDNCPPGQVWVPPKTEPELEWFSYSYRIDKLGTIERNDGSGWHRVGGNFNGVVYVGKRVPGGETSSFRLQGGGRSRPQSQPESWRARSPRKPVSSPARCSGVTAADGGKYKCIEPSIADFMQITFVGKDISLNRDLTYEDRPCTSAPERRQDGSVEPAKCPGTNARNVLGIYSDKGSIIIEHNAPSNMHIDGVLMAATKSVFFRKWKDGPPKGYLYLTGGLIENWYGNFGKLKPDLTIRNGYGRKFTYDPRMRDNGLVPPYFPTFNGMLPWRSDARYVGPTSGSSGFWKPVKGP